MAKSVSQTALRGRSQSSHDKLAHGLGYFSIALGVMQLIAPKAVCRSIGLAGHESIARAYGAREVATGVAILTSHDPTPWIWGRVLGDAADIATVAAGLRNGNPKKGNTALALTALAAVTAFDVVCATNLSSEKGGRKTAVADYSNRTGFPRGLVAARGAARDFQVPRDMRIPELLRPYVFKRHDGRNASAAPPSPN